MKTNKAVIHVDISRQVLTLSGQVNETFLVSSAANGLNQAENSFGTPAGAHYVRAKIGDGQPSGAVFVGRRPTGEIYSEALSEQHPKRDWILTRILWLCGLEKGVNRGGNVDSMRRYIYIHGTPDSEPMGRPASHGCIRMRNQDILKLFELTPFGTHVIINP